jgi:hypothetical protein
MARIYRWHPQLKASINGPVVNKTPLHLQQSDLDGACGPHCVLMALMLFGILSRDEVTAMSSSKREPLANLWKRSSRYYFIGSGPRQLQSVLAPYSDLVTCKEAKKAPLAQAAKTLLQDGVCIVGISNDDFSHWVLAVGIGGKEDSDEDTLLILDPGLPPLPLLPWNSTLSVKASRRGNHRYETALGQAKVVIDAVLLLTSLGDDHAVLEVDFDIDLG